MDQGNLKIAGRVCDIIAFYQDGILCQGSEFVGGEVKEFPTRIVYEVNGEPDICWPVSAKTEGFAVKAFLIKDTNQNYIGDGDWVASEYTTLDRWDPDRMANGIFGGFHANEVDVDGLKKVASKYNLSFYIETWNRETLTHKRIDIVTVKNEFEDFGKSEVRRYEIEVSRSPEAWIWDATMPMYG